MLPVAGGEREVGPPRVVDNYRWIAGGYSVQRVRVQWGVALDQLEEVWLLMEEVWLLREEAWRLGGFWVWEGPISRMKGTKTKLKSKQKIVSIAEKFQRIVQILFIILIHVALFICRIVFLTRQCEIYFHSKCPAIIIRVSYFAHQNYNNYYI